MVKITALLSNVSVRTLILGIDETGRVIQHDRNAPDILPLDSGSLVGAHLGDLVATPSTAKPALATLLDAVRAGREATAVLPIGTREGRRVETVASVQPMHGETPGLAALAVLKMPPIQQERFVNPALMRHSLLDDTFRQIGATLDLDQVARGLINILVPHFCTSAGLLVLENVAAGDEFPVHPPDGSQLLRRLAVATDDGSPRWDAAFPTGEVLLYPPGTPYVECMETGKPVRVAMMDHDAAVGIAESWLRRPVAGLLSEFLHAAAPAGHQGRFARLSRVHAQVRVPAIRRLRLRDRDGVRLPGRDLHRQRPPVQPGAHDRADPAAEPAADRAVGTVIGGRQAPLPAGQQAHRGRRRLV